MRVAVVTSYFPSSAQPWQGRTAYQTLRLLAARCELKIFYMESRYPARLTPRSRTFATLDPAYEPGGVSVEYLPYSALPVISRPFNGRMAARALLPRVRAWKPDILLSYIIYPDGDAALRISRRLGVPLVATAIGSDLNRISDPLVRRHTRRVLREAAAIMTVSGDLRRTALRLGASADRTSAVLNGSDDLVFFPRDQHQARLQLGLPTAVALEKTSDPVTAPSPATELGNTPHPHRVDTASSAALLGQTTPTGPPIILYVGRMDRAKGLRELIDAVATLRTRRPDVLAFLLGHGPDEPALRAAIHAHAAEATIRIVPPCPPDEVPLWMAASDLVTLPSYREGCPNVIVEALACGRPVVASDVGGIPELLDETAGTMVPAHNAPALAEALDRTLAREWDPTILHASHRRSWHDVASDVEGLLRQALFDSSTAR